MPKCFVGPRILVDEALENLNIGHFARFESEIPEEIFLYSLFEPENFVFVANQSKEIEKIIEKIANYSGIAIILDYEDWKNTDLAAEIAAKKRSQESRIKIYKESKLEIEQFKLQTKPALSQWITNKAKKMNISLSLPAINFLAQQFFDNLDGLVSELSRFASLKRQIELSDVQKFIDQNPDSNIFAVLDSIDAKDYAKAVQFLNSALDNGQEPFQFLALVSSSYLLKAQVFALWTENREIKSDEIAKSLKIHPFRAQKALNIVKKLDENQLLNQLNTILETEIAVKSGKDIRLSLEAMIVKL